MNVILKPALMYSIKHQSYHFIIHLTHLYSDYSNLPCGYKSHEDVDVCILKECMPEKHIFKIDLKPHRLSLTSVHVAHAHYANT